MPKPHETAEFDRSLVQMAESVREALKDHPSPDGREGFSDFGVIERIVDEADLVFGIWFDFARPGGVDKIVVKGADLLQKIIHLGRSRNASIAAIPCECSEQAEALRRHIAERETKH